MGFNSFEYLVFFGAVLVFSWNLLSFPKLRFWFLLLASYYFYTSHNGWLVALILVATQIDYTAALVMDRAKSDQVRKIALISSVTANLSILCFFKYFNFFGNSVASLLSIFGIHASWVDWHILLPVGISFYTFQNISYVMDVYRREIPAERSWVRYALVVAFFPHLVSGPIVRAKSILPQFEKRPTLTAEGLEKGIFLFFRGLFKKVVLADFLAISVGRFFDHPLQADVISAWLGVYAFAFQIYFDFSGYTDMAVGCARLLGYEFPENFRRPYTAQSLTDFWRRWHITLSGWLKNYLYRPLGGNRKGRFKTLRNILITLFLGGLWHGANWTFLLWGVFHGALLCAERVFKFWREDHPAVRNFSPALRGIYAFVTFQLVCISWVFFRAKNLDNIREVFSSLFSFAHQAPLTHEAIAVFMIILAGLAVQHLSEKIDYVKNFLKIPIPLKSAIYTAVALAVIVMGAAGERPFIYFKF